jgi:hypothetical protein
MPRPVHEVKANLFRVLGHPARVRILEPSVYYRVDDEHVFDLLEAGRSIISRQLAEQQAILQDIETS